MAGRGHVDVNERRLKPIYDYIDNRNYKKAVQEADKVLKKQKDLLCAKALKGLAMIRQGKQDSGLEILQEVHALHPTDDPTLQAVTISYGEMQEFELITDLYENANRLKPDNEDLLSVLFMAYVRTGNYQKQQRTAMALHKLKPDKNPYYFWALMSIVMQAHESEDKKQTFLKLAERMAEKFITSKKVEAEAEVMMYLMILELEEKYSEALELLNGPLGAKFQELNYRSAHSAELHVKLKQWSKANTAYKSLLVDEPDQWCYYDAYINSVIMLIGEKYEPTPATEGELPVDASVEQAQWFIKSRITCCEEKNQRIRGPYLAELELMRRLKAKGLDYSSLSSAYDLVHKFGLSFANKSCCYSDLEPYLGLLTVKEKGKFVNELADFVGLEHGGEDLAYPKDETHMWRHLTLCYFKHHLQKTWASNDNQLLAMARQYVSRYDNGLRFGTNRLKTDYQPCDDYLLLATTIYNHLYLKTAADSNMDHLWTIIGLLEKGLVKSPSNFKFKILLIHYYCILGAFSLAVEHWQALDVKHIQFDSIGYVIMNHALRFGHYPKSSEIISNMLKFFTINNKETTDFLISSYKNGSFNKIYEFVKFRHRLQNSFQFASATAEKLHMDLLVDGGSDCGVSVLVDIDPEHDKTDLDELVDNRDMDVLHLPEHPDMPTSGQFKLDSFEEEKHWLKIRNLTIRMLAAASQFDLDGNVTISLPAVKNGNQPARCMQEVLSELMVQLQEHITNLDQRFKTPSVYPLTGLYRTRIAQYLNESHCTVLIEFSKCLLHLYKYSLRTEDGLDDAVKFTCADRLLELAEKIVPCCTVIGEQMHFDAEHLERSVMIVELLCQATLLTTIGYRILKPLRQSTGQKRSKKHKTSGADLQEITTKFNGLVDTLTSCYQKLESVLEESQNGLIQLTTQGLQEVELENKDENESRQVSVKKVLGSYQISIGNLSQILQKKKACLQKFPS